MTYANKSKYRVSGAVFEAKGGNGPAFSGFVEIDGIKTHIALWPKTSAAGNDYLSISEDKRAADKAAGGGSSPYSRKPAPEPRRPTDDDDEIPF